MPVIVGEADAGSDGVPVGDDSRHDAEVGRRRQLEQLLGHGQRAKRLGNAETIVTLYSLAKWSSHSPEEQEIRVRIKAGSKTVCM
jgi:hypothetical protein